MLLFIGCGLVISASEIAIPKFLQVVVDEVVPHRDSKLLLTMFVMVVVVVVVHIALTAARNLLRRIFSMKASKDLQLALFRHLRQLGFSYYEQNPVGRTLTLLNTEVAGVQSMYQWYFPEMVQRLIMLLLFGGIMIYMNPKLSLLSLPCFLLYYIISPYFQHQASKYISATKSYRLHYNKKIYDSVSAVMELRAHSSEQWDLRRLMAGTDHIVHLIIKYQFNMHLCANLRGMTTYLGILLVFWFGAKDMQAGELTIGAFVAFVLYYLLFMNAITSLVKVLTDQRISVTQAEELHSFLHQKPEVLEPAVPETLPEVKGEIEFRGVTFGYGKNPSILNRFYLRIRPGERVALVGTSGNGKSTVLKLIGRFYDPREGEVRLDGVALNNLSFKQLRGSIGFVFQDTYLFGTTVRENIRFGNPQATEEQIVAAARAANAHPFITQFPDGYDSLVGERGIKLSGGQRQRIAIARMFLKNPSIVLLDEATSALDNVSEKEVQQALDQLLIGRTTVAVAHRLSTVKDYDRIVLLEDGHASEVGSYEELMAKRGAFYRLAVRHIEEEAELDTADGDMSETGTAAVGNGKAFGLAVKGGGSQ
ncbi:ABC transporter ATP-binding protein [Paenibacillus koleovorans]|uniref:ABC transporter ATP-binding protein n=1 Tax=Paenibacillus koleovorans TaxID=121608 RepID=UPI0013E3C0F7|nr:ABC transporter ATP-binding protein [Paenibacillus koleovorans]